jgi:hypothetical protein
MIFRKLHWLARIFTLAIILSACNLGATPAPAQDPGAIQTQAFNLVLTQSAMQITQTAQAIPPSPTATATLAALPTFAPINGVTTVTPFAFGQQPGFTPITSPLPTLGAVSTTTTKNGCNDGTYIGETEPFDGTEVGIGQLISKGFTILNSGTCTWDEGYAFAFLADRSSPEIQGESIVLPKNTPEDYTAPGHTQSFIVKFKAPKLAGEYKAYWKLRDDKGNFFGPLVYADIIVRKP